MVNYTNGGRGLRYCCCRATVTYGEPECQSLSGTALDAFVTELVLTVLRPAAIELHIDAATDVEAQRRQLHDHWRQRLERAEYQRDRAARQYRAVEPENRLVARELERQWEEALHELQGLQEEYEQFRHEQPARLTAAERKELRELARDLPALWHAETTTAADRQRIVRFLIERIVITVQGQTEQVDLTVHWVGEDQTQHRMLRGVQRYEQLEDFARLTSRMLQLRRQGKSMADVAASLNEEGFHPPRRVARFTGGMVAGFLARHGEGGASRASRAATPLLRKGEWLLRDLARHLGMPKVTLDRWRRVGWLRARKLPMPGGLWAVRATGPERRRLAALRRHQMEHPNQPIPAALTTPIEATTSRR